MGIITRFIVAVFVVLIIIVGIYALLTFPRVATEFSMSFNVGADREERKFDVPLLYDEAQIQVIVDSGSALWLVRILDSDENQVWENTNAQGGQTSYTSDWIELPGGRYNFIFGTVGIGDPQASVKVTTKGRFW